MTGILAQREETQEQTHKEATMWKESRNDNETSTVKARTTKDFWWHQKLSEEMAEILSTKQQNEHGSADTFIWDI